MLSKVLQYNSIDLKIFHSILIFLDSFFPVWVSINWINSYFIAFIWNNFSNFNSLFPPEISKTAVD